MLRLGGMPLLSLHRRAAPTTRGQRVKAVEEAAVLLAHSPIVRALRRKRAKHDLPSEAGRHTNPVELRLNPTSTAARTPGSTITCTQAHALAPIYAHLSPAQISTKPSNAGTIISHIRSISPQTYNVTCYRFVPAGAVSKAERGKLVWMRMHTDTTNKSTSCRSPTLRHSWAAGGGLGESQARACLTRKALSRQRRVGRAGRAGRAVSATLTSRSQATLRSDTTAHAEANWVGRA